jgi:hypothetical protein
MPCGVGASSADAIFGFLSWKSPPKLLKQASVPMAMSAEANDNKTICRADN